VRVKRITDFDNVTKKMSCTPYKLAKLELQWG